MKHTANRVDVIIKAAMKLDARDERPNVLAFIRSCYGGRVMNYDLNAASAALRQDARSLASRGIATASTP